MTTNAETPQLHTGGSRKVSAEGRATTATLPQGDDRAQTIPVPGWAERPYTDDVLVQARAARARRVLTFGSIRADLEEQPSARAVRRSARRWVADLLALAEDVATEKTENHR